jgi:hypothetical protein
MPQSDEVASNLLQPDPSENVDVTNLARYCAAVNLPCYVMFYMAIQGVVVASLSLFTSGVYSVVGIAIAITIIFAWAFVAKTIWSYVGVVTSEAFHRLRTALLTVFPISALGLASNVFPLLRLDDPDKKRDEETAKLILESIVYTLGSGTTLLIALWGIVVLMCVRYAKLPELSVSFLDLLKTIETGATDVPREARSLVRVDRLGGFGFGAAGILFLVAGAMAPIYLIENMWSLTKIVPDFVLRQAGQVIQLINIAGAVLMLYARRRFLPNADAVLAIDRRSPVLYLRSFEDDEKSVNKFNANLLIDYSFETRLSRNFLAFGPFVAVGSPRDQFPKLGAVRLSLSNNEWQGRVSALMEQSRIIIASIGRSTWIKWEIAELFNSGHWKKTIFVVPEIAVGNSCRKSWTYRKTVITFLRSLNPERSAWVQRRLPQLEYLRALAFCGGGGVCVQSRRFDRNSHHIAALVAHYCLLQSRGIILEDQDNETKVSTKIVSDTRHRRIAVWSSIAVIVCTIIVIFANFSFSGVTNSRLTLTGTHIQLTRPSGYEIVDGGAWLVGSNGAVVYSTELASDTFDSELRTLRDINWQKKYRWRDVEISETVHDGLRRASARMFVMEGDRDYRKHLLLVTDKKTVAMVIAEVPRDAFTRDPLVDSTLSGLMESVHLTDEALIPKNDFKIAPPAPLEAFPPGAKYGQTKWFLSASESSWFVATYLDEGIPPEKLEVQGRSVLNKAIARRIQNWKEHGWKIARDDHWQFVELEGIGKQIDSGDAVHIFGRVQTDIEGRSFLFVGTTPRQNAVATVPVLRAAAESVNSELSPNYAGEETKLP